MSQTHAHELSILRYTRTRQGHRYRTNTRTLTAAASWTEANCPMRRRRSTVFQALRVREQLPCECFRAAAACTASTLTNLYRSPSCCVSALISKLRNFSARLILVLSYTKPKEVARSPTAEMFHDIQYRFLARLSQCDGNSVPTRHLPAYLSPDWYRDIIVQDHTHTHSFLFLFDGWEFGRLAFRFSLFMRVVGVVQVLFQHLLASLASCTSRVSISFAASI